MKRPDRIRSGLARLAAAAVACAGVVPALAQAPAAKPTRPPAGPGSLTGVWNNPNFKTYRTGPPAGAAPSFLTDAGEPIPLQPEAAKIAEERRKGFQNGKPYANPSASCLTNGMPGAMSPAPELSNQIIETKNQVTVLFEEFSTFRIIHLNEKHPNDPDPTFMGNSVGHWEGDTLVVDTIAISAKTPVRGVIPHSEDLHVVERLRRTGPDTLEDRMTLDDPNTFTKPWTTTIKLKKIPGMRLQEYACVNNRNVPDANGHTGIQLKSSN